MRLLVSRLRADGYTVTENQEPGATTIGKEIRRILLDPAHSVRSSVVAVIAMRGSVTYVSANQTVFVRLGLASRIGGLRQSRGLNKDHRPLQLSAGQKVRYPMRQV